MQQRIKSLIEESLAVKQKMLAESIPVLGEITEVLQKALVSGKKILLMGNGGSAADAQHVAGELVGRFKMESPPWAAIALTTDTSILTCIGNDWNYDQVFVRQVKALAREGDVVVGISTSGSSRNVILALEQARKQGAITLGFCGQKTEVMAQYADLYFAAPSANTPRIQEMHLLAWHCICEVMEQNLMQLQENN